MVHCLKITLIYKPPKSFLPNVVQKFARDFGLEGTVHLEGEEIIRINICGKKEKIDAFIDELHRAVFKESVNLELEPFLKDKDYRGVFRIIE